MGCEFSSLRLYKLKIIVLKLLRSQHPYLVKKNSRLSMTRGQ